MARIKTRKDGLGTTHRQNLLFVNVIHINCPHTGLVTLFYVLCVDRYRLSFVHRTRGILIPDRAAPRAAARRDVDRPLHFMPHMNSERGSDINAHINLLQLRRPPIPSLLIPKLAPQNSRHGLPRHPKLFTENRMTKCLWVRLVERSKTLHGGNGDLLGWFPSARGSFGWR